MRSLARCVALSIGILIGFALAATARLATAQAEDPDQSLKAAAEETKPEAQSDKPEDEQAGEDQARDETNGAKKDEDTNTPSQAKPSADSATAKSKPKYPAYAEVLKDAKPIPNSGLITLHQKDDQLFAELGTRQLDRDYIVLITIARGIGQTPIVGGFSWGFGDDAVWQFRKAGENIQLVRRNVRFTAERGSPTEKAVRVAYTDSVIYSLPIRTRSPQGAYVVDLTPVFMSDLPQIGLARRHGERPLLDQRASGHVLPAAASGRPHRLLSHGVEGFLQEGD
jgi:hypothetical protein